MNLKAVFSLLLLLPLLFISCVKVDLEKPEPEPDPDPEPMEEDFVPWEQLDFVAERKIQNTLGTPFEFYLITEDVFVRINRSNELIEKRPLIIDNPLYGKPILSDNTFVRITENQDNRQILEFHLTRSPLEIRQFVITELEMAAENEHIEVDFNSRYPGTFSDDGVYFLLPTKTFPNHHYTCFLFEIRHTSNHNAFISIEVIDRIDIPELSSAENNLINVKFIGGNYYLATKEGGFRINPTGGVDKVLHPWIMDFFEQGDQLYATGFNEFDFHFSTDNGLSWERAGNSSELKMVEVEGGKIFTQELSNRQYKLADDQMLKAQSIRYNEELEDEPDSYITVEYFNGLYYISKHKEIYFNTVIQVE